MLIREMQAGIDMKENSYGALEQNSVEDEISCHAEEISIKGYSIIQNLISEERLADWRLKIDEVYKKQEEDFGKESLAAIQESDVCRSPLLYDLDFLDIAANSTVLAVVRQFLGDWFILNLQNAIINRPDVVHHQSSWHRDLPYQNYVISKPLAINALWAIDEFSPATGGTKVLPFTHKIETLPSDSYIKNNHVMLTVPAGSVIVFDAMLFHRAGSNTSQITRRAINHLYTTPIIKQQYDYPRALSKLKCEFDPALERLLGFTSSVHIDDKAWRTARAARLARGK